MHNDLLYCCIGACIVALIGDTSNHHKLLYLSQLPLVSLHGSFFFFLRRKKSLSISLELPRWSLSFSLVFLFCFFLYFFLQSIDRFLVRIGGVEWLYTNDRGAPRKERIRFLRDIADANVTWRKEICNSLSTKKKKKKRKKKVIFLIKIFTFLTFEFASFRFAIRRVSLQLTVSARTTRASTGSNNSRYLSICLFASLFLPCTRLLW